MKRSDRRILTSHVGSLPRPEALIEINRAKFAGEAYDQKTSAARLSTAVEQICRKHADRLTLLGVGSNNSSSAVPCA
jgi:5-methyltetrahydropteroyltriglutamate--homocysteine methyltransferase